MVAGPEWRNFERLIAAIHRVAHAGASVEWNEKVKGRQFDVTIRFKQGIYEYLTVVECRNRSKPATADNVDALVTKARDSGADRAVLASSSGFQSGASTVAKRHNIDLIHVTKNEDYLESLLGPPLIVNHIAAVTLVYTDGENRAIPTQGNVMEYYVNHIRIGFDNASRDLNNLLRTALAKIPDGPIDKYENLTVDIPAGSHILQPTDDHFVRLGKLSHIIVKYGLTQRRPIISDAMFEAFLLKPDIQLNNILTGDKFIFSQMGLPLGMGTKVEPGKYYESPSLGFYYYCNEVAGGEMEMWLIESFQCGQFVAAIMRASTTFSDHYVEVTDGDTLDRLHKRMVQLREKRGAAT